MTNFIKIFTILKTFNKPKQKRFYLFVSSPLFNKKREICKALKYVLLLVSKAKTLESFNYEKMYKEVFGNESYNANKLAKLATHCMRLLEQFIAHDDLRMDELEQKNKVRNYYKQNGLSDYFYKEHQKANKTIAAIATKKEKEFLNLYTLSLEHYDCTTKSSKDRKKSLDNTLLNQTENYLEIFYIISKLKLCCHSLNNQNIVKNETSVVLSEEKLQKFKESTFVQIPIINAYYNSLLFLKDLKNEQNFRELKLILEQNVFSECPKDEKLLYDFALNYCALKINAGESNYYNEIFELYKLALNKPIFYVDGYLFNDTVNNMISVALKLKELDWVEYFLESFASKFHPECREDICNYSLARLAFCKKEYDKSLTYIGKVNYQDIYFKIDKQKWLIKIYYEQKELALLNSLVNAFDIRIWRDESIVPGQIECYENFIKRLKQIVNTPCFEKEKLQKVISRIEETKRITEKPWLKEKALEKLAGVYA